jgi:hypothetical protein
VVLRAQHDDAALDERRKEREIPRGHARRELRARLDPANDAHAVRVEHGDARGPERIKRAAHPLEETRRLRLARARDDDAALRIDHVERRAARDGQVPMRQEQRGLGVGRHIDLRRHLPGEFFVSPTPRLCGFVALRRGDVFRRFRSR